MKKLLVLILSAILILSVAGCSSKSDLTMDDFIQAYTDDGVEIDKEKKPTFAMIGANDGVIFYMGNHPVKIYEYESEKQLKKIQSENTLIKDWISNDRFLLESSYEKAQEIFINVK